jgi:LysM repeat protein
MKLDHIPTRRQPVRKTLHARFFNKTKPRKQRATAAAAPVDDVDAPSINISRSLSIIFLIHIIAIGMIFVHKQYLSGRTTAPAETTNSSQSQGNANASAGNNKSSKLSGGYSSYMVKKGDNFSVIAANHQVDESELRNMNPGVDIRPGVVLQIPKNKRIVAVAPPEVTAITDSGTANDPDRGLVEILPPIDGGPQLVRPNTSPDTPESDAPAPSGRTYTVKSGDNIWRIATTHKVDQKKLLEINNIKDPTKLRIGQVLKMP